MTGSLEGRKSKLVFVCSALVHTPYTHTHTHVFKLKRLKGQECPLKFIKCHLNKKWCAQPLGAFLFMHLTPFTFYYCVVKFHAAVQTWYTRCTARSGRQHRYHHVRRINRRSGCAQHRSTVTPRAESHIITDLTVHVKAGVTWRSLYESRRVCFVWSFTLAGSETWQKKRKRDELTGNNGLRFLSSLFLTQLDSILSHRLSKSF